MSAAAPQQDMHQWRDAEGEEVRAGWLVLFDGQVRRVQRVNTTPVDAGIWTHFEIVCTDGAMTTLVTRAGRRDTIKAMPPFGGDARWLDEGESRAYAPMHERYEVVGEITPTRHQYKVACRHDGCDWETAHRLSVAEARRALATHTFERHAGLAWETDRLLSGSG